jgi:hypothetical protein
MSASMTLDLMLPLLDRLPLALDCANESIMMTTLWSVRNSIGET